MTDFRPVLYLKQNCPFCLKVRIFTIEAGLQDEVEIREFSPGTAEADAIAGELEGKLEKITYPAAQLEPGEFTTDSDGIVAALAEKYGQDTAELPTLQSYLNGAFSQLMKLYRENSDLKAARAG